jgi:radical SAM protein with 4Fe4S-binding SPASM domain
MPPELYERIRREILPHVERVWLVGLGEPLISSLFGEMIEDCIKRGVRFIYTTNGVRLTEELLEKTMKYGFGITLSVDGASRETFESVRRGISWELLQKKIAMIKAALEKHKPGDFHYSWNVVGMERNARELASLVEMAADAGVRSVTVFNFGVMERKDEIAQETLTLHPELVREVFPEVEEAARRRGIEIYLPKYEFYTGGGGESRAPEHEGGSGSGFVAELARGETALRTLPASERFEPAYVQKCPAPWYDFYVCVNGDIWPCCMYFPTALGNLREKSFKEIWNGAVYRGFRRAIHSGNPPYYCARCNLPYGITAGDETFFTRQRRVSGR